MRCSEVRSALNAWFDDGMPLDAMMSEHVDTCPRCSAYREQLAALEGAFHDMPVPATAPELAAGIMARLDEESPPRRVSVGLLARLSAVAAVMAVVAGWFYPLPVDIAASARSMADFSVLDPSSAAMSLYEAGAEMWTSAVAMWRGTFDVSQTMLWSALAAALAIWAICNGVVAMGGRPFGNGRPRGA